MSASFSKNSEIRLSTFICKKTQKKTSLIYSVEERGGTGDHSAERAVKSDRSFGTLTDIITLIMTDYTIANIAAACMRGTCVAAMCPFVCTLCTH